MPIKPSIRINTDQEKKDVAFTIANHIIDRSESSDPEYLAELYVNSYQSALDKIALILNNNN